MGERPLSKAQLAMLDRICRTNGGVSGHSLHQGTLRSLEKRELIQGKSGQESRAVHTPEGLALWRQLQEQPK